MGKLKNVDRIANIDGVKTNYLIVWKSVITKSKPIDNNKRLNALFMVSFPSLNKSWYYDYFNLTLLHISK